MTSWQTDLTGWQANFGRLAITSRASHKKSIYHGGFANSIDPGTAVAPGTVRCESRNDKTPAEPVHSIKSGEDQMGNVFRLAVLAISLGSSGLALASDVPIAGVKPYERPVGAPVITTHENTGAWYSHALSGISQPYPNSLRFLENQGAWYTPFTKPGMHGLYDIRGWHPSPTATPSN